MKLRLTGVIASLSLLLFFSFSILTAKEFDYGKGRMIGRVLKIKENGWPKDNWNVDLFIKGDVYHFSFTDKKMVNHLKNHSGKYVEIFYKETFLSLYLGGSLKGYKWQGTDYGSGTKIRIQ